MTPSRFQVAPRPGPIAAMDSTAPPLAGILDSPVSIVANPIQRPSGDQNGFRAPSVPARSCAAGWSSARAARTTWPSMSWTGKTTRVPSGESASGPDSGSRNQPSGATSEDTIRRAGAACGRRPKWTCCPIRKAAIAAAAIQSQESRPLRVFAAGRAGISSASGGVSSSMRASAMSWKRRSRSRSRQRRRTSGRCRESLRAARSSPVRS